MSKAPQEIRIAGVRIVAGPAIVDNLFKEWRFHYGSPDNPYAEPILDYQPIMSRDEFRTTTRAVIRLSREAKDRHGRSPEHICIADDGAVSVDVGDSDIVKGLGRFAERRQ